MSSSDVSEFTDVALSFVNTLIKQATEMGTKRTFSNQKPRVDRTFRAAVIQHTAAFNAGLLSGDMNEYKASCYALRYAVRAAKLRYRERIESHFDSWTLFSLPPKDLLKMPSLISSILPLHTLTATMGTM